MNEIRRMGLIFAGLLLWQTASRASIIITSAQINAYFGTATLLTPQGATLFTKQYLFLSNPISADLAAEITADPNANAFPIFQTKVTAGATFDTSLFVQEISNGNCQPAGPLCDPTHPLPVLPASANLTAALHNLPVPPGNLQNTLLDTGNLLKGNLPDFVVTGPATDGQTIVQASINISLFEHDFTAVAQPSAVPEPASGLLAGIACAAAFVTFRFKKQIQTRMK